MIGVKMESVTNSRTRFMYSQLGGVESEMQFLDRNTRNECIRSRTTLRSFRLPERNLIADPWFQIQGRWHRISGVQTGTSAAFPGRISWFFRDTHDCPNAPWWNTRAVGCVQKDKPVDSAVRRRSRHTSRRPFLQSRWFASHGRNWSCPAETPGVQT
jgi:hypothetical protein